MAKSVIRFSIIRLVLSVANFFSIGGLIGFFLTEGKVYVSLIVVYMILNLLMFSLIWVFLLNVPPREAGRTNRSDLLVLHIPTIIYFALTLGLLTADLVLGVVELDTIKYFYQVVCPLGINTIMICCVEDSMDSYVYYLSTFLNLMIYTAVITITYKRERDKIGKKF